MGPVGCTSVTWLDSPALAAAIRTGFAPGDRAALTAADARRPARPGRGRGAADGRRRADFDAEPGAPLLRPRRVAHRDLHHPAARQRRGDGRARAGVHADHGGRAALGDGVLRTDQPRTRPNGSSAASRCPRTSRPRCERKSGFKLRASPPPRRRPRRGPGRAPGRRQRAGPCRRSPPRSPSPTPGRSPTTAAGWRPASPAPGSSRCAWTSPRTPASPPPASRSAIGLPKRRGVR